MISPYVRRLRLGVELRTARTEAGLTHEQLAKKVTPSRQQIGRLELGHAVPDQNDVFQILEAIGIGPKDERWTMIVGIAREAAERGWWESVRFKMGLRQALIADLEAGAVSIRQYELTLIPGLLQTPEFVKARVEVGKWPLAEGATVEGILNGRLRRQTMIDRAGGPTYDALIDELALIRASVPPEVFTAQLEHLIKVSEDNAQVNIRILPCAATIEDYQVPAGSFSLFTYTDPGDPLVVALEQITDTSIITEPEPAERYGATFTYLWNAALSTDDSRDYLINAARKAA